MDRSNDNIMFYIITNYKFMQYLVILIYSNKLYSKELCWFHWRTESIMNIVRNSKMSKIKYLLFLLTINSIIEILNNNIY